VALVVGVLGLTQFTAVAGLGRAVLGRAVLTVPGCIVVL
jgi:hypothetical protein